MKDKKVPAIVNSLKNIEYYPAILDNDVQLVEYEEFPLTELIDLGGASTNIFEAINNVFANGGGSGIYRVQVADGGHLARKGAQYLGSTLSNTTNQISSQALLTPLAVDPMQLYMTLALAGINRKIDECTKIGQNILSYLELQDESKLIGNVNFLTDTLNSYKHNWNNPRYIESNLSVVQNIRREAEQSIVFHNKHIESVIKNQRKIHHDKNVISQFNSLLKDGRRYQLSLYMYTFASFLGVMFEENFERENIKHMLGKINDYSVAYRELYTQCYNHLEEYAKTSLQEYAAKGLSAVSKTTGKLLANIPVVKKSGVDKKFIANGDFIASLKSARNDDLLNRFIPLSDTYTKQFTESLQTVDRLFNGSVSMLFDKDNIYLKTT